jgi:hypothetical protein
MKRHLNVSSLRILDQNQTYLFKRDLTFRKMAARSLRASKRRDFNEKR